MATSTETIWADKAHFEESWKHFPNKQDLCEQTVNKLLDLGLLNVSMITEYASAHIGGTTLDSTVGRDHDDDSDNKIVNVRTCSYGKVYSAPVSNISAKVGMLKVMVYERKQDKRYYFRIPREAYAHIPKKSNIDIPFELNGDPRRKNRCKVNWWDFEVATFEEMAAKDKKSQ